MNFRKREVGSQAASLQALAELVQSGIEHPYVRGTALKIVRDCANRDDDCELGALFNAVRDGDDAVEALKQGFPYRADPKTIDWFSSPDRILKMCEHGACGGDCLPYDTLVLRHDYRLVPLAEVYPGDSIMGDGAWTTVTNRWDKDEKELLAITLANGSVLRVTEDHRLFRVPKTRAGYAGPRDAAEEVRAGDLRPDDDLLTIERIPFGVEALDADRAWLLGVHIADGWVDYFAKGHGEGPLRAKISGKDGHPKEAQKRRVAEIAERLGWSTRWHERYIAINDVGAARWLAATGARAPQKHVPAGLNYDEPTIRALLEGLKADASIRDGVAVHGTTSPLLATQLRVMYRMLGQSTHVRCVADHGGLGSNPIYRVTPRALDRTSGAKPHARVRSIASAGSAPVMDIETDSHRFYLPETDLVVHNCDEHAVLLASLAGSLGFTTGLRAFGPDPKKDRFTHVYAVALTPKRAIAPPGADNMGYGDFSSMKRTVVGLDTTVDRAYPGWQPEGGRYKTAWVLPPKGGV